MANLTIKVANGKAIKKAFDLVGFKGKDLASKELNKFGLKMKSTSMRNSPFDTGRMRRSHEIQLSTARKLSISVIPRAEYSFFVHEGTRSQKAQPWLDDTARELDGEFTRLANDVGNKILNVFARA